MPGPEDETAAAQGQGRGHLFASHADRDQVIGVLKTAFVQGLLAKDEFDQRVGQAFASRTYAELAAVTVGLPGAPTTAQPPKLARAAGEQPVLRPGPVIMVTTALYAGVWAFTLLPPWPTDSEGDPPTPIILLLFTTTLVYLFVVVIAVGYMIAGWREKRSGGRPPRRPAPGAGGQAFRRPPSAGLGGELPSVDGGQHRTAEAARSRLPRQQSSGSWPPHRWRYRERGYTIGYVSD
jgi:Domain of unknown function (DUF1707)